MPPPKNASNDLTGWALEGTTEASLFFAQLDLFKITEHVNAWAYDLGVFICVTSDTLNSNSRSRRHSLMGSFIILDYLCSLL